MSTAPSPSLSLNGSIANSTTTPATAWLDVCILSAYDLPQRAPPTGVRIEAVTGPVTAMNSISSNHDTTVIATVTSGPPLQRHKDRNAFKFDPRANLRLEAAALADLYHGAIVLTLLYDSDGATLPLSATVPLHQLHMDHTKWLVLNLQTTTNIMVLSDDDMDQNSSTFTVPPTIRLKLTLHGPYRTEIATAVRVCQTWCHWMDSVEDKVGNAALWKSIPHWWWMPLVPAVAVLVAATPVVAGVLVVALPLALPVLALLAVAGVLLSTAAALVYGGTRQGRREWVQPVAGPVVATLLATQTGQQLVYQTGPRPTPVQLCRLVLPQESAEAKLLLSLWMDFVGSASYLLPLVGELADVVWAPIQTTFIMAMYPNAPPFLKYLSFTEELLPLTDIVPSATIGWLAEFGVPWLLGKAGVTPKDRPVEVVTTTTTTMSGTSPNDSFTPSTPFSTPR